MYLCLKPTSEVSSSVGYIILCIAVSQSYQLKMVVDPKNGILINKWWPYDSIPPLSTHTHTHTHTQLTMLKVSWWPASCFCGKKKMVGDRLVIKNVKVDDFYSQTLNPKSRARGKMRSTWLVQWASDSSVSLIQLLTLLVLWASWKELLLLPLVQRNVHRNYVLDVYLAFGQTRTCSTATILVSDE